MQQVVLGNEVPSASIALGCMRMAGPELQQAERMIHTALEEGIDLFDHADIYGGGRSESVFGEVLKQNPGLRDKMLIKASAGFARGFYDASASTSWLC